ncbi:MAG: hypothetical protein M3P18_06275 [Actinomycetota bacterium]|nr:hypothetical protein [Actinomycetota bacterium]
MFSTRRSFLLRTAALLTVPILLTLGLTMGAQATTAAPFTTSIASLPVDPNSAAYIADAQANMSPKYLQFTTSSSWVYPVYHTTTADPIYSITSSGNTYKIRIPLGATPMSGNDGAMISIDPAGDVSYSLHHAAFSGGVWTASGISRTKLSSNWLDKSLGGDALNFGHRGVPVPVMVAQNGEVASGVINHALEIYWYETGTGHVFPMANGESKGTGVVPEGYFLRLRSDAATQTLVDALKPNARVVAKALQTYGGMIGDNAGGSKSAIKLERGFTGFASTDLQSISLDHYDFVKIP